MAPRQNSNNSANDFDISIEEIIFSCGICQATVSELYADKHKVHALSSSGDESGVIPKLWISECSHIFCGKHLEGGGAPFHSDHESPKARCPVCVCEGKRGHEEKRALYAIRGLGKGEYDEAVPDGYMRVPPVRLDSSDPSMDAMRFQYSHLVHYAKQVTKSWKVAEKKRRAMENTLSKERKQWRTQEADLNKRVASLEQTEARLNKWEQRKAKIDHYLNLVTKMSDEIRNMRGQLLELGYQVPEVQYAFDEKAGTQSGTQKRATKTSTHKNSSATLAASSSTRKRKHPTTHGDYADEAVDDKENHVQTQRHESRELMPPPLHRGKPSQPPSVIRPPQHTQSRHQLSSQPSVHVYEDQQWHGAQPDITMEDSYEPVQSTDRPRALHHDHGDLPLRMTRPRPSASRMESQAPTQGFHHDFPTHAAQPEASQPNPAGFVSMPPRRRSSVHQQMLPVEMDTFPPPGTYAGSVSHSNNAYAASNGPSPQRSQQTYYPSHDPPAPQPRVMAPPNKILSTPSLRQPLEPVNGPSASPFFGKRAPLRLSDTIQHPPLRGFTMQQSQAPPTRDGTMGRPTASIPRAPVQRSYQSRAMPPPPTYSSQNQIRPSLPPAQYRQAGPSYQEPAPRSQVGLMSEGLYQRHDQMGPLQPRQSSSQMHTGRLTMAPSISRPTYQSSQDSRLSMIPGARAAAASQNMPSRQMWGNAQGSSRYGSSYGGVRRPVQR